LSNLTFVIHATSEAPEQRVPVEDGLTLGRHPQCGCVLSDGTVSATHARVVDAGGTLVIEDLGGTNSTQANGHVLTKGMTSPLSPGVMLTLGQTRIEVVETAPSVSPGGGDDIDSEATVIAGMPDEPDPDATVIGGPEVAVAPPPPPPAPVEPPPAPPVQPVVQEPISAIVAPESTPLPEGEEDEDAGGTLIFGDDADPNDPAQIMAKIASLSKFQARLVFANEADRRVFKIEADQIDVGRKAPADCVANHPAVSSKHARITFEQSSNRFFIEDLGGRNKTKVSGEQLAPNSPRELLPEMGLAFGPIQVLFVANVDSSNRPIPPERYEAALEVLVKEQKIQPHQRVQALGDTIAGERHVGESLLLQEVITIEDWCDAYRKGESLILTDNFKKGGDGNNKLLIIVGAVVAIILIVVLLLNL
jgi:pSer/pThr/pTyr-binding forkhead associated (FHA) protein